MPPMLPVMVNGKLTLVNLLKVETYWEDTDGFLVIEFSHDSKITTDMKFDDFLKSVGVKKPSPIELPTPGLQLPR